MEKKVRLRVEVCSACSAIFPSAQMRSISFLDSFLAAPGAGPTPAAISANSSSTRSSSVTSGGFSSSTLGLGFHLSCVKGHLGSFHLCSAISAITEPTAKMVPKDPRMFMYALCHGSILSQLFWMGARGFGNLGSGSGMGAIVRTGRGWR